RNREGGNDRYSENSVRHRDVGEGDNRHPEDIEKRNHHPDRVRAEPVEPAERIFALLLASKPLGPGQYAAPMLAHELRAAEGPAMRLGLVGFEGVGKEPVTVATVAVEREPAMFEHGEAEIGILDDGVARPAADTIDRCAADETHRAVHDDAIELVALHHADIEESGIFRVHRSV